MIDNLLDIIINPILEFLGKHSHLIFGIIANVIVVIIINKIINAFEIKLYKRLKEKNSASPLLNLMPILTKIVKSVIIFLLLAGFLESFGYNVSSLIAGFGITGLAVGFAAKEAIGNIFGSVGLLSDRVYKIGDYIQFGDIEGFVEKINLRSTSIRTLDDFIINVPNNTMANAAITNVSMTRKRKIDILVDIEYGTPNDKLDRAIEILREIADHDADIMGSGNFSAIEGLEASSIQLRLFAYTNELGWFKYKEIKGRIIREIIHRYREEGIEFAFPSTSVYMK